MGWRALRGLRQDHAAGVRRAQGRVGHIGAGPRAHGECRASAARHVPGGAGAAGGGEDGAVRALSRVHRRAAGGRVPHLRREAARRRSEPSAARTGDADHRRTAGGGAWQALSQRGVHGFAGRRPSEIHIRDDQHQPRAVAGQRSHHLPERLRRAALGRERGHRPGVRRDAGVSGDEGVGGGAGRAPRSLAQGPHRGVLLRAAQHGGASARELAALAPRQGGRSAVGASRRRRGAAGGRENLGRPRRVHERQRLAPLHRRPRSGRERVGRLASSAGRRDRSPRRRLPPPLGRRLARGQ